MDGTPRSTTTKTLALAAMLVAAGVLFLRAQALFAAPATTVNVGTHQERSLTALLEPIIGPDQVRTSIRQNANGQMVWLIMLDGPALTNGGASPYTDQIETVARARGFDPATDALNITQTPFARAQMQSLSPRALAELGGLGLIVLLSFGVIILPTAQFSTAPAQAEAAKLTTHETSPSMIQATMPTAAALANAAPERTASIIRNWMRSDV